ncbi:MAG: hypothetical protein WBQ56_25605, partial [Candidatus Sulfotelmatobacter sp.]
SPWNWVAAMDGFLSGFFPECAWRSESIRRRPASAWHWNIWDANHHYALPAWTPLKWAFATAPLTICIQNGICAFAVEQQQLFREAIRVTRSGGLVMFSSYTPQFWEHRLEWFEIQSAHHLIGEIDYQATGNGMIVCKDGFRATTADRTSFEKLAASLEVTPRITEVDGSSLFCEFVVP